MIDGDGTGQLQSSPQLEQLLEYLRLARGFDFTGYKRASLERRIHKRIETVEADDFAGYLDYLQVHPAEFEELFDTILINVTAFFRDTAAWEYLAREVAPQIAATVLPPAPIRIWCPGCSSGQEAYTVAIVLGEVLGEADLRERVKIYATDVDEAALAQARGGSYTAREVEPVPAELMARYFVSEDGRSSFRPDLRRSLIFGRHDLVQDAPISRIDLIVCRNTLMYFNGATQSRILANFAFALRDGGFLFLGKSEVPLSRSSAFQAVDLKQRVFRAIRRPVPLDGAGPIPDITATPAATVLEAGFEFAPVAHILVDRRGRLAHANESARTLFGVTSADFGRQLQDFELSYRPVELRSRIEQAFGEHRLVTIRDVEWPVDGGVRIMDVEILPLMSGAGEPTGTSIAFADVTRYRRLHDELRVSQRELESAYEELQSTVEELETTNEELQSTNEELETTNEELQSTNEELETINDELRDRSGQLDQAKSFLESIVTSIETGVIVVDGDLRVQVWNSKAADLWGLRGDEVAGQHLFALDIGLPLDELRSIVRASTSDGDGVTREIVVAARNRRGRDIACRVAVTPLPGADGHAPGAILLMEPVDEH